MFWFLSLSLSLATVLIGILCIQWLREYERRTPLDPQDAIALRQLRYQGLTAWQVPKILMCLPVLLHISLILFFVGLIDLLWALNHVVAFFVTITAGLVLLFVAATTLLPALQLFFVKDTYLRAPQCAYKSPQSWVFHRMVVTIIRSIAPASSVFRKSFLAERYSRFYENKSWVDYDTEWREIRTKAPPDAEHSSDTALGLAWIDRHLGQTLEMVHSVYHCIKDLDPVHGVQVVSQISESMQGYLRGDAVSNEMKAMSDETRREFVSALFLEVNNRAFPQVDQSQVEAIVRILNTRVNDTVEDTYLIDSPPFTRWPLDYVRGMPTGWSSISLL